MSYMRKHVYFTQDDDDDEENPNVNPRSNNCIGFSYILIDFINDQCQLIPSNRLKKQYFSCLCHRKRSSIGNKKKDVSSCPFHFM